MRRLARQGFRLAKMEEVEEGPERYTKSKVLALPEREFVSVGILPGIFSSNRDDF